jgi:O-antigen/teichoic acid export membrane protein
VPILFGSSFRASITPLLILLPGLSFFSVTTVLAGYITGVGKPQVNLTVSSISLVVILTAGSILVPKLGIDGAAIANSASYIVSTLLTSLFFRRLTGIPVAKLFVFQEGDWIRFLGVAREIFALVRIGSFKSH